MAQPARSVLCCALRVAVSICLVTRPAHCLTVGGWDASRGGQAGILNGIWYNSIRSDLATYFPGVTLAETGILTSTFLSSIDVLMINPVYDGLNVEVNPLDSTEQSALSSWVFAGGQVMTLGENLEFEFSSNSMINPFGPTWKHDTLLGHQVGTVTDHTSFPAITDGPFGVVNTFGGDHVGFFDTASPATVLGSWSAGHDSLAAMNYGSGKVVIAGDVATLIAEYGDNVALRRNTLAYLLNATPHSPYDYNHNGLVDAADYVLWRKTLNTSGLNLPADGNHNNQIDPVDYALWRGDFGLIGFSGSGASLNSGAVPEPTSIALLLIAFCLAATRTRVAQRITIHTPLAIGPELSKADGPVLSKGGRS